MLTKEELPDCPVAATIQLIGNKWKLLILRNLLARPWRFNEIAGFNKKRLFYTQGDYGLFQCSKPCCKKTWENETMIRNMVLSQGFVIGAQNELVLPEGKTVGQTAAVIGMGSMAVDAARTAFRHGARRVMGCTVPSPCCTPWRIPGMPPQA